MSLDTCFDALRFLARSSELRETRLTTAELRINELLEQVKLKPAAQRALLAAQSHGSTAKWPQPMTGAKSGAVFGSYPPCMKPLNQPRR